MAGFNISMERIDDDYQRVVNIDNETRTLKRELNGLYESQEDICEDLRLASKALYYARKECKKAKKLYKCGKIDEDEYLEYDKNLEYYKDSIRRRTEAKRKNGEMIKSLRSAIKSNEELLMARVDARYDWET